MEAGLERKQAGGLGRKLLWLLLVILLPLLVSAGMVGVALQLVGVPVLKDIQSWIRPVHTSQQTPALRLAKQHEAADTARIATLERQVHQLEASLGSANTRTNNLEAKLGKLKNAAHAHATVRAQAMQEASVLVAMDTGQAAQVLAKMTINQAAQIVALMSPADSGAILGQMDPTTSGKILLIAGQDAATQQSKSGNP